MTVCIRSSLKMFRTWRRTKERKIGYLFYLRRRKKDADDVLYRLSKDAAAVITDDYPTFIAAEHNATVPRKIGVAYYAVDSGCVVPAEQARETALRGLYHPAAHYQDVTRLLAARR